MSEPKVSSSIIGTESLELEDRYQNYELEPRNKVSSPNIGNENFKLEYHQYERLKYSKSNLESQPVPLRLQQWIWLGFVACIAEKDCHRHARNFAWRRLQPPDFFCGVRSVNLCRSRMKKYPCHPTQADAFQRYFKVDLEGNK